MGEVPTVAASLTAGEPAFRPQGGEKVAQTSRLLGLEKQKQAGSLRYFYALKPCK
jgi:hypothetical protein